MPRKRNKSEDQTVGIADEPERQIDLPDADAEPVPVERVPATIRPAMIELVSGAEALQGLIKDADERFMVFQPGLTPDEWETAGRALGRMNASSGWWLGDWIVYGEQSFKDKIEAAKAIGGWQEQTAKNMAVVAKTFPPEARKYDLEPSVYAEVGALYRKDPKAARRILAQAEKAKWTQKQVRASVRESQRKERPAPEMPAGLFNVILVDPPWQHDMDMDGTSRAVANHYPTMSVDQIVAMDLPNIAADAVLFMWAVPAMLPEALRVMAEWGFDYKASLVWDKEQIGMGYWVRNQHEILLVGAVGDFAPPSEALRPPSVFRAPRGRRHSQKPTVAYELIESMFPDGVARIELFARDTRPGWVAWGNDPAVQPELEGTEPGEPLDGEAIELDPNAEPGDYIEGEVLARPDDGEPGVSLSPDIPPAVESGDIAEIGTIEEADALDAPPAPAPRAKGKRREPVTA